MTKRDRRLLEVALAILVMMGMTFLVYEFGAERIVSFIGVENSYLVVFLVALFGGMTSLGGPTYVATVFTFVSGGATPFFVALAATGGIIIGDTVYFLVSRRSRHAIPEGRFKKTIQKMELWIEKRNGFAVFLFAYGYISFTPFPNDILTITTGVANVPKKVMLPAILFGSATHAFILVYLGKTLFGV